MAMPPSWRGATRTSGRAWGFLKSLGVTSGQDRSFRTASCGVAPGDAGGGSTFQGLDCHPDQIPRPPFDRIARIGRPAGAIFRGLRCPGSCLQPPRSRRGGGTAPVTHACHQARGEVRPRAFTPTPSSQRKLGSQERKDPAHIPTPSSRTGPGIHPAAWPQPPGGCRNEPGMTGYPKRGPGSPRCQRASRRQSLVRPSIA